MNEEYRRELQMQANDAKMILIGILTEFKEKESPEDNAALDAIITSLEIWQNT